MATRAFAISGGLLRLPGYPPEEQENGLRPALPLAGTRVPAIPLKSGPTLTGGDNCFRCRRGSDRGRWRRNLADGLCQPRLTTSEVFALIHRPSFALMISRSLAQGIWGYAAVAAQVFCLVAFLGRRTEGFLAARSKATCRCLSVCCAPRSPRAPCCARC